MMLDIFLIKNIDENFYQKFNDKKLIDELMEVNNFEPKKNRTLFVPKTYNLEENDSLIVGIEGCSTTLDYLTLGSKIRKKIHKNYDVRFISEVEDLDIYSIEFGFELASYEFDKFISDKSEKFTINVTDSHSTKNIKEKLNSIFWVRDMVNFPALNKTPEFFVEQVEKLIKDLEISLEVKDKSWLEQNSFGGVLGVASGSVKEPMFLIGEYNKSAKKQIALIGKGVLFDSGGLSLKSPSGMETMKTDMAGAATAWGVIALLAKHNVDVGLKVYTPLVENMPGSNATRPGDIIKSYKGINVEVLNTDAEGRLVLADIITYGCEVYKPKIVIDFATLTGAIMVALGQHYAGMFSNDDGLSDALYKSGIETNEKVWRMPLHDDFDKELNSPFVDLKNIGAGRYGGSVTAAQFLQRFVPPKTKWAHLDIAGTTWKNSGDILNSKGATGFGLTLIADFIDRYFKN